MDQPNALHGALFNYFVDWRVCVAVDGFVVLDLCMQIRQKKGARLDRITDYAKASSSVLEYHYRERNHAAQFTTKVSFSDVTRAYDEAMDADVPRGASSHSCE